MLSFDDAADAGRSYTIGDLSRRYGVSLRALRFYEERELLRPHRKGVRRVYSDQDCLRLETILKAKRMGFSLTMIWDLLRGRENEANPGSMTGLLGLSRDQIGAQIERLERKGAHLAAAIEELRTACVRSETAHDAQTASYPRVLLGFNDERTRVSEFGSR